MTNMSKPVVNLCQLCRWYEWKQCTTLIVWQKHFNDTVFMSRNMNHHLETFIFLLYCIIYIHISYGYLLLVIFSPKVRLLLLNHQPATACLQLYYCPLMDKQSIPDTCAINEKQENTDTGQHHWWPTLPLPQTHRPTENMFIFIYIFWLWHQRKVCCVVCVVFCLRLWFLDRQFFIKVLADFTQPVSTVNYLGCLSQWQPHT